MADGKTLPPGFGWIERADDPRMDDYRDIRDRDLLGPGGRGGLFIGEQMLTVEKMLTVPGVIKSVLISPNWVQRLERIVDSNSRSDVPVYVASQDILQQVAGFRIHRGVLAVGYRPPPEQLTLDAVVPKRQGDLTVLLCEGISNIDNIGLLFRNAAAFGVDAVVLSPGCHDPLYRKSIRVSIGHVLNVPWAQSDDWPRDLNRLKEQWNLTLFGAATGEQAVHLDAVDFPRRVGLIVGAEYAGLSKETKQLVEKQIRIPMAAGVDSLNVGVAAAVCLHRLSRGARR